MGRARGLLLLIVVMTAHAWSAPLEDGFEVASVKLSANQNAKPGLGGIPPIPSGPIATLSLSHATFRGLLIGFALHTAPLLELGTIDELPPRVFSSLIMARPVGKTQMPVVINPRI